MHIRVAIFTLGMLLTFGTLFIALIPFFSLSNTSLQLGDRNRDWASSMIGLLLAGLRL